MASKNRTFSIKFLVEVLEWNHNTILVKFSHGKSLQGKMPPLRQHASPQRFTANHSLPKPLRWAALAEGAFAVRIYNLIFLFRGSFHSLHEVLTFFLKMGSLGVGRMPVKDARIRLPILLMTPGGEVRCSAELGTSPRRPE